jgi:hypothetical protein
VSELRKQEQPRETWQRLVARAKTLPEPGGHYWVDDRLMLAINEQLTQAESQRVMFSEGVCRIWQMVIPEDDPDHYSRVDTPDEVSRLVDAVLALVNNAVRLAAAEERAAKAQGENTRLWGRINELETENKARLFTARCLEDRLTTVLNERDAAEERAAKAEAVVSAVRVVGNSRFDTDYLMLRRPEVQRIRNALAAYDAALAEPATALAAEGEK